MDITFFNGPPLGQFADLFCDTAKFATWSIESVKLIQVSEDDCPTAATIGDHAFDKQDLSWTLTSESPDSSAFMANNELVLKTYTPCIKASASQTVMAPGPAEGADKSLALLFDLKASENAKLQVTAGELNLRRIQGTGSNLVLTETICLSKPFVASNIPLKFELGSCAEDNKTTALIDNVRFEYVASCNHEEHLVDGGFESAAQGIRTWGHYGFENTVTIQQVKVNTGLAAAQIRANSPCFENGIFTWFNVPPATLEAGPALSFTYLFPSGQSNAIPQITVGEQYGHFQLINSQLGFKQQNMSEPLKPSDTWKKQTLCLDPNGGGRRARLKLGLFGGAGVCDAVYDSEELWIDDVTIELDPSCPGL